MPRTNHPRIHRALLLASALVISCKGSDPVTQAHYRLETAYEQIEQKQYAESIELLDQTLADFEADRDSFVVQRFYANCLLTQAQILQALTEQVPGDSGSFQSRRMNPRIMAAMLHIGNALDLADAAASAPRTTSSGQKLLPGRLDALSVEDAGSHLQLLVVGFYGGLRFNDRMRISLDRLRGLGELQKYEEFEAILDRLEVIEGVRPWLLLAVHRAIRDADPREAYKFAITALHHEESRLDPLSRQEITHWIEGGSSFSFLCTQCDEKVIPDRPACFNCGANYLEAYGVEREGDDP